MQKHLLQELKLNGDEKRVLDYELNHLKFERKVYLQAGYLQLEGGPTIREVIKKKLVAAETKQ